MPDTATAPSSLADIISAAQAIPAAPATPAAPIPDAAATQADTDATTTTTDDSATTTTTTDADGGTAQTTDAASTATDASASTTDTTSPDSIDWGSAMPALAAKAQQLLGAESGVFTKYNNMDDLIRSIAERERQVGQLSNYAGAFNQLAQNGVTVQMLQALMARDVGTLQSLLGQAAGAASAAPGSNGNGNGQPAPATWSKKFLAGRDAEGKPLFNRAELARAGINEAQAAQLFAGWQDQAADLWSGPEAIEEYIAKIVESRVGQATQQTEQKLTAAQQQALHQAQQQAQAEASRKAESDAALSWAGANANLLYVNKKSVDGGVTPFFQQMQDYINSGVVNPQLSHAQQLEVAKNYVLAVNRPAAPAVPTPSDKAKRQPATGAQPTKLSPDEFDKKYRHLYADQSKDALGLAEYMIYAATGKVPQEQR